MKYILHQIKSGDGGILSENFTKTFGAKKFFFERKKSPPPSFFLFQLKCFWSQKIDEVWNQLTLGGGCGTVVERTPNDQEGAGLIPAIYWAFPSFSIFSSLCPGSMAQLLEGLA